MHEMIDRAGLKIARDLVTFVEERALPGTDLDTERFWFGVAEIYRSFTPRNRALLERRDALQAKIDLWHSERVGESFDQHAYISFLTDIGYLLPEPDPFAIAPNKVDDEIAMLAGPQLIVPVTNARYLLNAANARWGSLYDALYGSDVIVGARASKAYDSRRGTEVIEWAKSFLDTAIPLDKMRWKDLKGPLSSTDLIDPTQFLGKRDTTMLFRHNGLHIEVVFDSGHPVGRQDPAGIADIILESALTTICDFEDSVAAVDAEDKLLAYANWFGLMKGDLEERFNKNGVATTRRLNKDRVYVGEDGSSFTLKGRSLLFVRSVGHLTTTPAIILPDGAEAPEGILDGILTSLIAIHDLKGLGRFSNSRTGSIYIVKPKMHGPDETAFANDLFGAIEDLLKLPRHTIKIGVMDEERRTSANLAACISAVKDRIIFINTGFLDRTGDEIHTSMQAGAMIRKGDMKSSAWIKAYEDRNVQIGLRCGFSGKAQIGKGMWAAPDRMADMLMEKIGHPMAGANTAWVPSPTAATLHATHYHMVDIFARHVERIKEEITPIEALLTIPLTTSLDWSKAEIEQELENNVQGILGYVVRWIDQGIGCSKVPDIYDVGLMEDRATLRISSQHIANWLAHGVCSAEQVDAAFSRMALKVDVQNSDDPLYRPLSDGECVAFQAARALVFEGKQQPSGYTEPLLHGFRRRVKRSL